ncbi:hypothetical protein C8F04DRAFT_1078707 [Mycena alexandri]|uniref:DUF7918 domain-containing protein n=1 Tax=Mycena alexandri TaxID=1745969 RepID=A0AAD6TAC9_9AGAR|nr:hypothetical protein C8F04DRAFT_1078707 [Mycena alexandri]
MSMLRPGLTFLSFFVLFLRTSSACVSLASSLTSATLSAMQLGPLHSWITVDGVELTEFALQCSADGTEASCWIPSECDKQFTVHFKNTEASSRSTVNAHVVVDGISCGSKALRCRDRRHPHTSSGSRDSVATSATTRRSLFFGQQALTDDDTLLNAAISPELGSIKVVIATVRARKSRLGSNRSHGKTPYKYEPQTLHERSKKAMGHSVQFGAEFKSHNSTSAPVEIIKILATFVFKYRPLEILRAEGIAPPAVRREPAAAPVEVLDLTLDDEPDNAAEIKKLETRLRELKGKGVRIKEEPLRVKNESGVVIDLT